MPDHKRDVDGQPSRRLNQNENRKKTLNELYGLCEGILADRVLVEDEIRFLAGWLAGCNLNMDDWPAGEIAFKVAAVLDDGNISPDEARELQELLLKAIGGLPQDGSHGATRLPCEDSPAPIEFAGRTFCFTGKFGFGERKLCQAETTTRGGLIHKDVTRDLDYLVIGMLASRDWAHTNHGRKIEAAVRNQHDGCKTRIVTEEHWCLCLT